ncbi:MAG: transcription termination factor Rho [Syntrophaceae bacterium]|nr:transcription termination factor Rho [Syntrophaceae bacterium]
MEKEKQLEKLTVKELREMALEMGGITGVTAMKKEELIAAIRAAKGLPVKQTRERPVDTVLEIKRRIRECRAQREELRGAGRRADASRLNRKISRLKKKTRRLARKAAGKAAEKPA